MENCRRVHGFKNNNAEAGPGYILTITVFLKFNVKYN